MLLAKSSVVSDSLGPHGPNPTNPWDWTVDGILSSVHGILQARVLEWAAMTSSKVSSRPRDQTHISYVSCIGRQVLYHWAIRGSPLDPSLHGKYMGKSGSSDRFTVLGSKITTDSDYSHKIKRRLFLGRKAMTNLDSILKSTDITWPTKVHISQSYGFSSSQVQICELDHKEGWALKNWCIQTVVLEKSLESPLDSKDIKTNHS